MIDVKTCINDSQEKMDIISFSFYSFAIFTEYRTKVDYFLLICKYTVNYARLYRFLFLR